MAMTFTLTPEQERRLEAEVAAGRFESVEQAIRMAIDHFVSPDISDLSWAKSYIDVARAQIERGEFVTHEEFKREITERIRSLGG
jgi:antitoxin ParD1/3/4